MHPQHFTETSGTFYFRTIIKKKKKKKSGFYRVVGKFIPEIKNGIKPLPNVTRTIRQITRNFDG